MPKGVLSYEAGFRKGVSAAGVLCLCRVGWGEGWFAEFACREWIAAGQPKLAAWQQRQRNRVPAACFYCTPSPGCAFMWTQFVRKYAGNSTSSRAALQESCPDLLAPSPFLALPYPFLPAGVDPVARREVWKFLLGVLVLPVALRQQQNSSEAAAGG